MFGFKLTTLIYGITGFSALMSLTQIASSVIDLALMNSGLSSSLVQIQIYRVLIEVIMIVNGCIFSYAVKIIKSTLLVSTMVVYCVTGLCRKFLIMHTVFIRTPSEVRSSFIGLLEDNPISAGSLSFVMTLLYLTRCHFLLQFCWKHKICGIRVKDRVGGMTIRTWLLFPLIFTIMAPIFTIWNRAQLYFNADITMKFKTDYWYTLSSTAFLLVATVLPIRLSYDLILGLKMKSCTRLKMFYRTLFVFLSLYGAIKMMVFFQEKNIVQRKLKDMILLYLTYVVNILYVVCCLVFVFLYRKYLKHVQAQGSGIIVEKVRPFRLSKRKLLNIRTIDSDRIIVSNTLIGSGCWSTVYLGELKSCHYSHKKGNLPVAIKIISGSSDPSMATVIYEELKNTSRITKHPNLVNFIGACFLHPATVERKPLGAVNIVMELYQTGSLENFVQSLRHRVIYDGTFCITDTEQQLWRWSLEIATGMEYLGSQGIIHGDLAARNILLDEKLVAKISDFGMSRKLYEYQQYARIEQSKFPWKWMAPETLDQLKFTFQSDVYSYGVLLWEIYSLGQMPWSELCWTSDFVAKLKAGAKLKQPACASDFIYNQVMIKCWKTNPQERPRFSNIVVLFQGYDQNVRII